jgi:hypothetical protein
LTLIISSGDISVKLWADSWRYHDENFYNFYSSPIFTHILGGRRAVEHAERIE